MRQGERLSPLLVYLVLDKVMFEWGNELKIRGHWEATRIDRVKENIDITCLAFSDV